MNYAIIEFDGDGTVSYVPTIWIFNNDGSCYWPVDKNKIDIYRQQMFPPKKDWEIHEIKKIFGYASMKKINENFF